MSQHTCETCGRQFKPSCPRNANRFCSVNCYDEARRVHPRTFIAQALLLWESGHPVAEIGRRLGVTKDTIIGVAHRNNFPSRPSPIKRAA